MIEMSTMDRLRYLEEKTRTTYATGLDRGKLAELALEVVVNRGFYEEKLEKTTSAKERKEIEDALKRIRELEKYIRQVYVVLMMRARTGEKERKYGPETILGRWK